MYMFHAERDSVAISVNISSGTYQRKAENKLNGMILFTAWDDFFGWSFANTEIETGIGIEIGNITSSLP